MAILEILTYPDPRLKEVSQPVGEVDDDIRSLVNKMLDTMYQAPGIGLAAPQVGVLKRVMVIDIDYREGGKRNPLVLVNPEIVSSEGGMAYEEGCLSVPEFTAEVERFERVTAKGLNEEGEEVEIGAEGLLSVAIQHEIDHLDGILFIDRLGSVKRDIFKRRFKKISRKRAVAI